MSSSNNMFRPKKIDLKDKAATKAVSDGVKNYTYELSDTERLTATIKEGGNGMVHHLFEDGKSASAFLDWLKSEGSPLTEEQKEEIEENGVNVINLAVSNHPYKNTEYKKHHLVRLSQEQFKTLQEALPDLKAATKAVSDGVKNYTYELSDTEKLTATIKEGGNGMVHHLFEDGKSASAFLDWLKSEGSPLTEEQKEEIEENGVNVINLAVSNHPYKNTEYKKHYLVRLSQEQFKTLQEALPDLKDYISYKSGQSVKR